MANGNWIHAVCPTCWLNTWAGRLPARLGDEEPELCCFCGRDTSAGLYVKRDPSKTPCQGGRGLAALFPGGAA
jgi:hypothetical protein